MRDTKEQFALNLSYAYQGLVNELFTAFELYTNTYKEKSLAEDRAFRKENYLKYLESERRTCQEKSEKEDIERLRVLDEIIARKKKESGFNENENPSLLRKKKKIIGEQIIVFCNSAFEKFRVNLIELLFHNNQGSMKQYINTFRDVAADRLDKTGDRRYVKVHDADSIEGKNLKLLQEYNKISSIEKRMHGIDLENQLINGVYNKNLFVYTMFREIRNLVVHRSKEKNFTKVELDVVFIDSIKNIKAQVSDQGKAIDGFFKEYLGLNHKEVLEILDSKKLDELRSRVDKARGLPTGNNKLMAALNDMWEAEDKVRFNISPSFILDSIMSIVNLAHLYCFSICEKNNLDFQESLFNDMCIDYYENDNKNVYINFFVSQRISVLYVQKFMKNKGKISQDDALRVVNFILANDVIYRHMADNKKVVEFAKKNNGVLLSLLKNNREEGEIMYNIVSSYIKRDLCALTKATDKWLELTKSQKDSLFNWYIYRSLSKEPYIDRYLSAVIKK
tara:strand:- start:149 stop:1666 length:1518 start_codon:yes stop_codon:yes gene_type:complete